MEAVAFIAGKNAEMTLGLPPLRLNTVVATAMLFLVAELALRDLKLNASDRLQMETRIGVVLDREPADASVIESLCRMGLFESAHSRCRMGISASIPGSLPHARWTSLLIETLALQDSEKANSIQKAFSESQKVYDAYVSNSTNQAFKVWVEYSYETVRMKLANRSVANYLTAPQNSARRNDVLECLRNMLDHLATIKEAAQNQMGVSLRRNDRDSANTVRDLGSLINRSSLLEIDCMLLRSDCYPPDSNERIAGGTEALTAIEKIEGRVASDWNGQELLELAKNQSIIALSRYSDAVKSLDKWVPSIGDPSIRNRAVAMQARASVLMGDLNAARKALSAIQNVIVDESPDIALAALEILIASWKEQATKLPDQPLAKEESAQAIEEILKKKDKIADRFGTYWKQRSEALIVAASLGKSYAPSASPSTTSLDLLKVDIRQRVAANDLPGAVALLEQAEVAALASNDPNQAFAFAKTVIGLLQQQSSSSGASSITSQREIVDRMAQVAKKYSAQEKSALLHQVAIEHRQKLFASESNLVAPLMSSDNLSQMLLEHVVTWPNDSTSDDARKQLQSLYLNVGDISALIELWNDEITWLMTSKDGSDPSPIENRNSRLVLANTSLVNGLLLDTLTVDSSVSPQIALPSAFGELPPIHRWTFDVLSGDYAWWMLDGGLRMIDGKPLTWSVPSGEDDQGGIANAIAKILHSTKQPEFANIEFEVQTVIDWTQSDIHGRLAYLVTLYSSLSNIVRLRGMSDTNNQGIKEWNKANAKLKEVLDESMNVEKTLLNPMISKKIANLAAIIDARNTMLIGEFEQAVKKIEVLRQSDPRSPRWTLELARVFEMQGLSGVDRSLQLYRQLAAGSQVGSDLWFESRMSSVRCLRSSKKSNEADEIIAMVRAMVADVPEKWKQRIK